MIANILEKLNQELIEYRPDLLLVQGDTCSAFAGSLTAFNLKIPVAHIEAGLRTNDKYQPFPEEVNLRLISQLATIHFAPTNKSAENLRKSNIIDKVFITGNTVIDALKEEAKKDLLPNFLN